MIEINIIALILGYISAFCLGGCVFIAMRIGIELREKKLRVELRRGEKNERHDI